VDCFQAASAGCWSEARERQKEIYAVVPLYRQQMSSSTTIIRLFLMPAFDARLPLPFGLDASAVRLKEALNYLDVPTPTWAKLGEEPLTRRDARQVQRTMDMVLPLAK
jgi:hypothetical protein